MRCPLWVWSGSAIAQRARQAASDRSIDRSKWAKRWWRNALIVSTVTLYNCSVGRQDCSLCKNAGQKYSCVWCAKHKACVYEKLCTASQPGSQDPYNVECPNPEITDVSSRRCWSGGHGGWCVCMNRVWRWNEPRRCCRCDWGPRLHSDCIFFIKPTIFGNRNDKIFYRCQRNLSLCKRAVRLRLPRAAVDRRRWKSPFSLTSRLNQFFQCAANCRRLIAIDK